MEHQMADQSWVTKRELDAEASDVSSNTETAKVTESGPETTISNSSHDFQLVDLMERTDNDSDQNGDVQESVLVAETNGSQPQAFTDPLQVLQVPFSEDASGSPAIAFKEQLGTKANSQCDMEKNQEINQEESSSVSTADVRGVTKEAEVRFPVKKKRRMGMCGLTEKEHSHFLQAQTCENGQNQLWRVEKRGCRNTADLMAKEGFISPPPEPSSLFIQTGSASEQREPERQPQPSDCEGINRKEAELHVAVVTSDGLGAVSDPGSEEQSCVLHSLHKTGDTKSDPPAGRKLLEKWEQQELEGQKVENMAEIPPQQVEDRDDSSAVVDQSPAISFYPSLSQEQAAENGDVTTATSLLEDSEISTRDENSNHLACDTSEGASSAETSSGGCPYVPAAPSCGSKREDTCDPDDDPGACAFTLNTEPCHTRSTTDPFGPADLDYVSDSQLNAIPLIEEEIREGEEDIGSPDCPDVTDLICGLIAELSSLNRKVMAAHKELENLRRSTKILRSSTR